MRRFHLTVITLLTAFSLLAAACAGDDPAAGPDGDDTPTRTNDRGEVVIDVDGTELVLTSALSGFDDCDALLDHLRSEAAERVGPYGFDGGGWWGPVMFEGDVDMAVDDIGMADAAEAAPRATGGDDSGAASADFDEASATIDAVEGVDFSGTNVQEIGVDEADIIKTDGERIFVIAANQLIVVDAAERVVTGTVDLPSAYQAELFLDGDEILLVASAWSEGQVLRLDGATTPVPAESTDAEASFATDGATEELAADIAGPWYGGSNVVRLTRISVDGGEPSIVEAIVVEGELVSSRAIDGTARVIVRSNPQYDFPFVYPQNQAGEEIAENANRAAVEASTLADWLPAWGRVGTDGSISPEGLLPTCGSVHAPTEFAGFGVLSVLSLPVAGPIDTPDSTSVLAPGSIVYASTESVYVATQTWIDPIVFEDDADAWETAWNNRRTSLHRFALDGDGAAYTASGSVAGDVRDQFSLSEYDGYLRVVTTTGESWDESSETFVRVLRETDGELVEVGSVGDMGNGEAVQSVRFVGDVGYVVTFRQVDPFYTLDLRDPENPQVVGELKIPGFSSYLHPIGNGRVLGVGSDATDTGQVTGSKVSIFDVSDPANPLEVAVWTAPGAWNDVGWEHRSFLWWEPEQLAVIPVNIWDNGTNWAGAVVLRVDGSEITEVGRIDHIDERGERGATDCRPLTGDDLARTDGGEFETEFEYMIADEWTLVLECGPGERPAAEGFECSPEPWLLDEAARAGFEFDDDTELVMCWDNGGQVPTISRTMVIDGDELWTLSSDWGWTSPDSPGRLQVNDLTTLERLDHLTLS